ncbi:MAG: AAA family ATPase [Magnetococcales bacterium]|nr:AAA family ATPase [Magnetococcales bacterium]
MIQSLQLKDFTVFSGARLEFSPGLNVIVGENGVGKSHLLKLAYSFSDVGFHGASPSSRGSNAFQVEELRKKLTGVFQVEDVGQLVSRFAKSVVGWTNAPPDDPPLLTSGMATIVFQGDVAGSWMMSIGKPRHGEAVLHSLLGNVQFPENPPLFLPPKEMVSSFAKFAALYEEYHIEFEEAYYDLCKKLARPLRREEKWPEDDKAILAQLEEIIGGKLVMKGERFYFQPVRGGEAMEVSMMAEGHRKLGTLAYLIANNSLPRRSTLFWDEPEANLNPRLSEKLAQILVLLAKQERQVVLATHSLFLLKELDVLLKRDQQSAKFFALERTGEGVQVHAVEDVQDLDPLAALDAELEQFDRIQALYEAL